MTVRARVPVWAWMSAGSGTARAAASALSGALTPARALVPAFTPTRSLTVAAAGSAAVSCFVCLLSEHEDLR